MLAVVLGAAAVAGLRAWLFPVRSFRDGLTHLSWGMPADSVRGILGEPNRICTDPGVAHLTLGSLPDTAAARRVLAAATAERWVYTRQRPPRPVPRDPGPVCRAPATASELGFDSAGRLRWRVEDAGRAPARWDPSLASGPR